MRKIAFLALLALTLAGGLTSYVVISATPAAAQDDNSQGDEDTQ